MLKSRRYKENVEALTIALRSQAPVTGALALEEAPPATIADALAVARRRFADELRFGDSLSEQLQTLTPISGPPDKILRYFETLAQLSIVLRSDRIGKSVPIWLREAGVEASVESDTIKKSAAERRRRTFRIDGQDIYCELHAKPNENVSPDQCVRIYFHLSDVSPHVQIGYLGRHFE